MTAASPGPGPNIFSMLSGENDGLYRARRETFVFSMLGQAAIVGLLVYFTSCVIRSTPEIEAIEAVNRWRFRPATLNGQPVATQIAVQVDFHLY